jgi:hypothetical protein
MLRWIFFVCPDGQLEEIKEFFKAAPSSVAKAMEDDKCRTPGVILTPCSPLVTALHKSTPQEQWGLGEIVGFDGTGA